MQLLKISALILLAALGAASSFAQSRPNVDTLSISGLKTAAPTSTLKSLSPFDTLFWNDGLGVGMLSKKGELFGHKGEYRVAIQNSAIEQVSFAIGAKNSDDATKIYNDVTGQLHNRYGDADATVTTDPPEIRWEGMAQFFAVRMAPEHNAVNIVLSKFEHH